MAEYTINLIPEPGTPAFENMLRYMREAFADPRNVRFRRYFREDEQGMAFLTQGGSMPLPEVQDPIRPAFEVNLKLVVTAPSGRYDQDSLADAIQEFLHDRMFDRAIVVDSLIEDVRSVRILDKPHYHEGDHFQNPLDAESYHPKDQ